MGANVRGWSGLTVQWRELQKSQTTKNRFKSLDSQKLWNVVMMYVELCLN